jgi:hypothetical protein
VLALLYFSEVFWFHFYAGACSHGCRWASNPPTSTHKPFLFIRRLFLNRSLLYLICVVPSVSLIVQLNRDVALNGGHSHNGNYRIDSVMVIDIADSISMFLTVNK